MSTNKLQEADDAQMIKAIRLLRSAVCLQNGSSFKTDAINVSSGGGGSCSYGIDIDQRKRMETEDITILKLAEAMNNLASAIRGTQHFGAGGGKR